MSGLEKAEAALSEARATWRLVTKKLGLARGRAEQVRRAKGPKALAAATGDQAAADALDKANESLLRAGLEVEDLEAAERQAAGLVAQCEARVAAVRDAGLADAVEAAAARFTEASVAVDEALAVLARAIEARVAVAQELLKLAPASAGAELSHRLLNTGPILRAARHAGLGTALRLPWAGEKHHEAALATVQFPEIAALVARLRGDEGSPAADREAA